MFPADELWFAVTSASLPPAAKVNFRCDWALNVSSAQIKCTHGSCWSTCVVLLRYPDVCLVFSTEEPNLTAQFHEGIFTLTLLLFFYFMSCSTWFKLFSYRLGFTALGNNSRSSLILWYRGHREIRASVVDAFCVLLGSYLLISFMHTHFFCDVSRLHAAFALADVDSRKKIVPTWNCSQQGLWIFFYLITFFFWVIRSWCVKKTIPGEFFLIYATADRSTAAQVRGRVCVWFWAEMLNCISVTAPWDKITLSIHMLCVRMETPAEKLRYENQMLCIDAFIKQSHWAPALQWMDAVVKAINH